LAFFSGKMLADLATPDPKENIQQTTLWREKILAQSHEIYD
jgi:hypothetical protein